MIIAQPNIQKIQDIKTTNNFHSSTDGEVTANYMPNINITKNAVNSLVKSYSSNNNISKKLIYNPKQAPSNISTEAFLDAKFLSKPMYVYNEAQTRSLMISNYQKEAPKYQSSINLFA